MFSAGMVNGTRTPSQPWHGGLAVAVDASDAEGIHVSAVPAYDTGDGTAVAAMWQGLPLVHFSAQPDPFPSLNPPNTFFIKCSDLS
jgi:hypothetical protein